MDWLAKETIAHVIDPLTAVFTMQIWSHWLTPISNRFKSSGVYLYMVGPISLETNTRATQEIPAPDKSWGGCNNLTLNWPYQGPKVPFLITRIARYLPALWPDLILNTCTWVEDPLWYDGSQGLQSGLSERSWIILSDISGYISCTTPYSFTWSGKGTETHFYAVLGHCTPQAGLGLHCVWHSIKYQSTTTGQH